MAKSKSSAMTDIKMGCNYSAIIAMSLLMGVGFEMMRLLASAASCKPLV